MRDTMFCVEDEKTLKEEFRIERCVRVLPHDQNTGGFFIAVFRKLKELEGREAEVEEGEEEQKEGGVPIPVEPLEENVHAPSDDEESEGEDNNPGA